MPKEFKQPKSNTGYKDRQETMKYPDRICRAQHAKEQILKTEEVMKHYCSIDEILLEQASENKMRAERQKSANRIQQPNPKLCKHLIKTEPKEKERDPHTVPNHAEQYRQWQSELRYTTHTTHDHLIWHPCTPPMPTTLHPMVHAFECVVAVCVMDSAHIYYVNHMHSGGGVDLVF